MLSSESLRKKLRGLVKDATNKRMTQAVKFYAEKLVALSKRPEDIYTLALAYHDNKEYRRAVTLLRNENLTTHSVKFTYLAAKCLLESKEFQECIRLIGADACDEEPLNLTEQNDWRSAIFMLRGRTWEALENLEKATLWYKRALIADPYCYEAFDILTRRNLLPHQEEKNLIDTLSCLPDGGWIKTLYACFTSKYSERFPAKEEQVASIVRSVENEVPRSSPLRTSSLVNQQADSSHGESASNTGTGQSSQNHSESLPAEEVEEAKPGDGLVNSINVQLAKAEWHYYRGSYSESYLITKNLLRHSPESWELYPVHLSCCLELKKQTELYQTGQELSRINPETAVTWFAIGVYYMCIKRYYEARKSFGRAHAVDKNFSHAWIGFGNAFAGQEETEQAMAAYRTANRLFPGLHLPSLYLGMENLRLNHLELAEINFLMSYRLCPQDPLVSNELGVLEYNKGRYEQAIHLFQRSIEKCPGGEGMSLWEAVFVNLGHALRKQRRYEDAIQQYKQALVYRPNQAGTLTAIGFTYHLQDKFRLAIENYQAALNRDQNDQFAQDMLKRAVDDRLQSATIL